MIRRDEEHILRKKEEVTTDNKMERRVPTIDEDGQGDVEKEDHQS